jgi:CubicO group peptidase (beta-lactamase class C family)
VLAHGLTFAFVVPTPAGGMRMTPAEYATFLQRILDGSLALHDHLGENAVCTLPPGDAGGDCKAKFSPAAPYAWHYSYAHWVEDDASIGDDGAFSSPGLYGFYPWIDASKTYYGIVARQSMAADAYIASAQCGRLIRKAFLTKTEQ